MNIKIPEVTLVAVDCTDRVLGTINALNICSRNIDFGRVKLLSHEKPLALPDFIEYNEIPKISNIDEYNQFMFMDLGRYIDTSHCLTVQDHAYIINASAWNDEFLEFSYLGAPWAVVPDAYMANNGERARVGNGGFSIRSKHLLDLPRNGNGGFSLRSKKLMDAPHILGLKLEERQGYFNEDGNLAVYHRAKLLEYGIRYAPVEIASEFAYENTVPENEGLLTFGYHRNLPPW